MTPEEREEMQRHFGVLTEDVHSQLRMVAEGNAMTTEAVQRLSEKVDAFRADFDGSRLETAREFTAVRAQIAVVSGEAGAFRVETAHNFADLRAEIRSSYKDTDRRLKTVEARHASRR